MERHEKRKHYLNRLHALKVERQSWDSHWKELNEAIRPRRSKFFTSDRNDGRKKNQHMVNNTPTRSLSTLSSGMMAGITSPARPWLRYTTSDPSLNESSAIREYLHRCERITLETLAKSNVYNALHQVYSDLGQFATTAMHVDEDDVDIVRAYVYPIGQYCLANSATLRVDTVYREMGMTVGQLVERFGLEACSASVRDAYTKGQHDQWRDVLHVIEPNVNFQLGKIGPAGMRWRSCWMEMACDEQQGFLKESGYEEFPVMAPRWEVTGEDVYGFGPGFEALGDARALQLLERRKAQAIDKIITPPMTGPGSLLNGGVSLLPGDFTPNDAAGAGQALRPAIEVNPNVVPHIGAEIREHERRIQAAFHADMWLMMAQNGSPQMTAREVAERHEEKMLQLGPVMERLQDELLDPLIDRVFAILERRGLLPPPPPELQGKDIKVEYLSIMSQAQKMVGTTGIERFLQFVGQAAATNPNDPSVLDKANLDQAVDVYADMLGISPDIVRSDEAVAAIREQRAQAQQAAQQAEMAQQQAQTAKTLGDTSLGQDNALGRMLGTLSPLATPASGLPQ